MDGFAIYLIVRKDLKMQSGKIAAQCCHAVESLVLMAPKAVMQEYRRNGHPKIVLQVNSLDVLEQIRDMSREKNLPVHMVKDAGLTQVEKGSVTVLGIGPVKRANLPEKVTELKLL